MERNFLAYTVVISLALILFFISGYFFPGSLNWGFHFLGFLPWYATVLFGIAAVAVLLVSVKVNPERFVVPPARFMDKHPVIFVGISLCIFITAASLFRIPAPLLGDSFTLLYNFSDFKAGIAPLAPWHEPLSIFVLYHLTNFLGTASFAEASRSFFIVHLTLGCCFIITIFFIVRNVFSSPAQRLLVFILLLILPYMTFFMGYIEVYSVSTVALAVFVLCSILAVREKISFIVIPTVYLIVTLSHVIGALLGLSVIYLAYREYKRKNFRDIFAGFAISAFLAFILLVAIDFDTQRLLDQSPISHFLSLTNNISLMNNYSQAYTVFSIYHAFDLFNYFVLMSPFALIIIIVWCFRHGKDGIVNDPIGMWGIIALCPVFLYLLDAKLEQGTANDWDTFAAFFFLLNLIAAYLFFRKEPQRSHNILLLIIGISLLSSLTWFTLNATTQPSIDRFKSLWDKRILSHLGRYTMSLRVYRYYHALNDTSKQISTWDDYSLAYPDDPRGYANTIEAINTYTPADDERKLTVYHSWYAIDPANDSLRSSYGTTYYHRATKLETSGDTTQYRINLQHAASLGNIDARRILHESEQ